MSDHGLILSGLNQRFRGPIPRELRSNFAGVGFRAAMLALQRRYRAGDVVVIRAPFLLHACTGMKGDFGLQQTTRSVVVDADQGRARYSDKWIGNPVLRKLRELKDLLCKHGRAWLVATPFGPIRQLLGEDLYEFVSRNMRLELENRHVRLYQWESLK